MNKQAASVNFVMALLSRHNDEMVAVRRRLAEANGGNGEQFILGYMFLDPARYQRQAKFCVLITDEDEIAMVKKGWKSKPEMDVDPAPGRICVIGSYN